MLSHFNRVRLFVTPQIIACQALLCVGFCRQVYWSGLPCPSPGDLSNPGMEPRSSVLQVDSLPSKPPGKPKNTWVGCHALLQGIFLTQELNWGLLHCRQILYQLRAWQPTPVFLPGESPWTEEHGGLQSMALQRVRHTWMTKHRTAQRKKQWKQKLVLWKDQQKWKVYLDWPR